MQTWESVERVSKIVSAVTDKEENKKRVCKDCGYRYSHSFSIICPDCIAAKA